MRNPQMVVVSRGATRDTGKADTNSNPHSVVNRSGIGKPGYSGYFGVNKEDQFTDGLRRAGAWKGEGKPHYISDRMLRREAERKAAKAARKGGAK